jgi:hypothetical protein
MIVEPHEGETMRRALIAIAVALAAGCSTGQTGVVAPAWAPSTSTRPATAMTTTWQPPATTAEVTRTTVPTITTVVTTTTATVVPRSSPRPTPDQETVLVAGLLQIEPGFAAKKPDILVYRARNVCSDMLPPNSRSREQLIDGAIARFTTADIAAVTRAQGAAIVDLIRTTFCF